jgi:hypothetical protein
MKKLICLLIALPLYFFTSCEKGYKEEIFIDKYQVIYGIWEYQYSVLEGGYKKEPEHFLEFIPYGQFRYNRGKPEKIKIAVQTLTDLCITFKSFPKIEYACFSFIGTDTMDIGADRQLRVYYRK